MCEKCFQISQTTSGYCTRFVDVEPSGQVGEEVKCKNCKYHHSIKYHDKMWCRDCQQKNKFESKQDCEADIPLKSPSKFDFTMTDKIEDYPVYDKEYLDECIKKATPGLSKIKDVDKTLDEIRGKEQQSIDRDLYVKMKPKKTLEGKLIIGKEQSQSKLYQCPYSKACKCNLKDCCLECETFGEYLNSKQDKEHSEKLSVENCDSDCVGPHCEGCRDFKPIEQQFKRAEEILAKCALIHVKELEFKNEVQIIRPSEAIEAMQEYAESWFKEKSKKDWDRFVEWFEVCYQEPFGTDALREVKEFIKGK